MSDNTKWNLSIKNIVIPLTLFTIFLLYGLFSYINSPNIFYIANFTYLGLMISIGIFLSTSAPRKLKGTVRRVILLFVGSYLLLFVGIINKENLQIEGFFFHLFYLVGGGAIIHYLIAKIIGPIIFGRGFCGWACWLSMIYDNLPFKTSPGRIKNLSYLRYITLFTSFFIVYYCYSIGYDILNNPEQSLLWFVVGVGIYYISGISLAYVLKDNRAFCKYLCPIPTIQQILGRFSLLKIKIDKDKCINCKLCEKKCPMDIQLLKYKNENKRILSTECVLCNECNFVCPKNAIGVNLKFDYGKNYLRYKEDENNKL